MNEQIKNAIDQFVEFLIKENCEGCEECEPRLPNAFSRAKGLVCCEEGRAKWFLQKAEEFINGNRKDNKPETKRGGAMVGTPTTICPIEEDKNE